MNHQHEKMIDGYGRWCRSWDASERTISARQVMLRGRLAEWGVGGFTTDNVVDFLSRPKPDGEPRSRWTKATYHGHLTSICAWMLAAGIIPSDPMPDTRKPKRPKSLPRPLSDVELEAVLSVVKGQTRDWLLLALHLGLRAHEIAKIKGQDVTMTGVYVMGKGGVPATLPCHPVVWEMAQRYPRTGPWFPGSDFGHMRAQTISMVVGRLFHALGIEGSIHRVRHSFGTRLMDSGANLRQVQQLMRHANLDTTALYTQVREDGLRDAILGLPPVA